MSHHYGVMGIYNYELIPNTNGLFIFPRYLIIYRTLLITGYCYLYAVNMYVNKKIYEIKHIWMRYNANCINCFSNYLKN